MLLKMTFHQSVFRLDARLTFPQARLRQSQPRLQEYWFFVLGAIFNSKHFSSSFLHFDARLTFPKARLVSLPTSPAGILIFGFWAQYLTWTTFPAEKLIYTCKNFSSTSTCRSHKSNFEASWTWGMSSRKLIYEKIASIRDKKRRN